MRQAEEAALAGPEGRAGTDDHLAVRVWLRLLSSSLQIEGEIRKRLRARFGISLARFDVLAQLARHPEGLQMNRLSSFLMVTGGNVTGLTVELEREGYVLREPSTQDRRAVRVRLTVLGEREFARMAREHEAWVRELLQGLSPAAQQSLHDLLGRLRIHLTTRTAGVSAARRKGAR
jgi:DNA-binding MarR family transcriptional regulator